MSIITWITRKITGRHEVLTKAQTERIKRLPKDQARKELGAALFELGVRHATEFVKDELSCSDPPFKGVPPETVFHEILAMTFWIMDKEIAGGSKALIQELHEHCFRSLRNIPGTPEERRAALGEKYKQYEREWDDITGHQDEFGMLVVQNICGPAVIDRMRERTFWVIRYAHEVSDDCALLKKTFRAKFRPDTQTTVGA